MFYKSWKDRTLFVQIKLRQTDGLVWGGRGEGEGEQLIFEVASI